MNKMQGKTLGGFSNHIGIVLPNRRHYGKQNFVMLKFGFWLEGKLHTWRKGSITKPGNSE